MSRKLRLAILGCGAITQLEHLPAVLAHPDVELVALVDNDLRRAKALRQRAGASCDIFPDSKDVLGKADAVVNALPNHLHAPVSLQALHAGMHVLCEKPVAITSADALACAEAAEQKNVVLAIGMSRRFVASSPLLHLVLREEQLGTLGGYNWQYGGALDWKSASGFYFNRALAGGGVLIDLGVHLLDNLMDWFGPATLTDYEDDNWGSGIEANCSIRLEHAGPRGKIQGYVRLSRTFALNNRLLVDGTLAQAEISNDDLESVILHRDLGGQAVDDTLRFKDSPQTSAFYKQLENFVQSVRGLEQPRVNARTGAAVLALVEQCYAHARRIPEPWSEIPAVERVPA